jgi:hypothetical protein
MPCPLTTSSRALPTPPGQRHHPGHPAHRAQRRARHHQAAPPHLPGQARPARGRAHLLLLLPGGAKPRVLHGGQTGEPPQRLSRQPGSYGTAFHSRLSPTLRCCLRTSPLGPRPSCPCPPAASQHTVHAPRAPQDLLLAFVDCVERNGAKLAVPRTALELDPGAGEALSPVLTNAFAMVAAKASPRRDATPLPFLHASPTWRAARLTWRAVCHTCIPRSVAGWSLPTRSSSFHVRRCRWI